MTDPGLTDLIAAHRPRSNDILKKGLRYRCSCGWTQDVEWGDDSPFPAHVALVLEQHTNRRIAELEAELEKHKSGGRTLGKTIDRTLKDVVAAVGAEDMIDEDGDGDYAAVFELLFELRPARDAAAARAAMAEAKVARVETLQGDLFLHGGFTITKWEAARLIRAALEGEQQ